MLIDSKKIKKFVNKYMTLAIELQGVSFEYGDETGNFYYEGMKTAYENILKFLNKFEEEEDGQ